MRSIKFLSILLFIFCSKMNAQDIIYKNDKSQISSKIIEITDDLIKYKKWTNQNGPIYSLNKADVFMIIYQNGEKEIIESNVISPKTIENIKNTSSENLNNKIIKDDTKTENLNSSYTGKITNKDLRNAYVKLDFKKVKLADMNFGNYGISLKNLKYYSIPPIYIFSDFMVSPSFSIGISDEIIVSKKDIFLYDMRYFGTNLGARFNYNFTNLFNKENLPHLKYNLYAGLTLGIYNNTYSYSNYTAASYYNLPINSTGFFYYGQIGGAYFFSKNERTGAHLEIKILNGGTGIEAGLTFRNIKGKSLKKLMNENKI